MSTSNDSESRRPGAWPVPRTPVPEPQHDPDAEYVAERHAANRIEAHRHLTIGRIAQYLEQETDEAAVREAVHNWCTDIEQAGEDIIRRRR